MVLWLVISITKYYTGEWEGAMVCNTTFNNISVIYLGGQFYWWRKLEYPERIVLTS
jgi:hypothetical protein